MRFRQNKKSRNFEVEEFDITSLLDILVILLVFLLKSFNDAELTVDLVNELALPYSLSRSATNNGVILQVNAKKNIFVNTEVVGNMDSPTTFPKVRELLSKEYKERVAKLKPEDKEKGKDQLINFVFDKSLKFVDIDKIMNVTSDIGFSKYKLIIQGEE